MSNFGDRLLETKISNRKIYNYENIAYYKVIGMKHQYYIKASDYYKVTLRQSVVELFESHPSGLCKIKGYIKSIDSSDILLIAAPTISSSFVMYDLEKTA